MDFLDATGLRENTLIVLWGDHGFLAGEHGAWGKDQLFDLALRSPLVLNAPWLPQRRIDALVEQVDIYPTLCELSNIPVPEGPEGRSLVPLIENPSIPFKTVIFQQTFRDIFIDRDLRYTPGNWYRVWGYSVRSKRFRYSEWREEKKRGGTVLAVELYDYADGPLETVNLVNDPAYRQVVLDHADLLKIKWN